MAPTKANATYAATTLSLLTRGPTKVIGKLSLLTSLPANAEISKSFRAEKVRAAVAPRISQRAAASATWLKKRELNALKSP